MGLLRTEFRLRLGLAVLLICLSLAVSACGRKGQPEPPPGADFPRTYPSE